VLTRIDELLTFARTQGIDKMRLSHSFKLELDIVESGAMKSGSLQYGGENCYVAFDRKTDQSSIEEIVVLFPEARIAQRRRWMRRGWIVLLVSAMVFLHRSTPVA